MPLSHDPMFTWGVDFVAVWHRHCESVFYEDVNNIDKRFHHVYSNTTRQALRGVLLKTALFIPAYSGVVPMTDL